MDDQDALIRTYNYPHFVAEDIDRRLRFDQSPPLGRDLPDFPLLELDGAPTSLSEVWRAHTYTVIEFGSFT